MPTKRKNDETAAARYEQSRIAQLQRQLGWMKTQEIEINASPSACLAWMKSLGEHPSDSITATVDTQSTKRPYKFKAHVRSSGLRSSNYGIIIGDVEQREESEQKSLVTLRLYPFTVYASFIYGLIFLIIVFTFAALVFFFPAGEDGRPYGLLCGIGYFGFIGGGLGLFAFANFKVFQYGRALGVSGLTEHLLRLNAMTKKPAAPLHSEKDASY